MTLPFSAPFLPAGLRYAHDPESVEKRVELIQSYPELCGCIDSAANKPFAKTVDVRVDDLPVSPGTGQATIMSLVVRFTYLTKLLYPPTYAECD